MYLLKTTEFLRPLSTHNTKQKAKKTYRWIHLIITSDVFMQSSQHDHGYHARKKQDNNQRVHDAEYKKW